MSTKLAPVSGTVHKCCQVTGLRADHLSAHHTHYRHRNMHRPTATKKRLPAGRKPRLQPFSLQPVRCPPWRPVSAAGGVLHTLLALRAPIKSGGTDDTASRGLREPPWVIDGVREHAIGLAIRRSGSRGVTPGMSRSGASGYQRRCTPGQRARTWGRLCCGEVVGFPFVDIRVVRRRRRRGGESGDGDSGDPPPAVSRNRDGTR